MKTSKYVLLLAALLLSAPAALMAQTTLKHDVPQGHDGMQMPNTPEDRAKMANTIFDKMDADRNSVISRDEFLAHHRDMDHGVHGMQHAKGGSDHAEMDHSKMDHAAHRSAVATFAQLDFNKDGKLSKAEMAKHPMAGHFSMMDENQDGFLSTTEFASH